MALGERAPQWMVTAMMLDFVVAGGAFMLSGLLRFGSRFRTAWEVDDALPPLLGVILIFGVLTVGLFWLAGAYQRSVHVSFAGEVRDVFRAVALTGVVTLGLLYVLRLQEVSRLMLVYLFISLVLGATATRWVVGRAHLRRLDGGDAGRALLIVGGGEERDRFLESVGNMRGIDLEAVGFVGEHDGENANLARLGAIDDLAGVLARHSIDEVAVCLPLADWSSLDAVASVCEEQGVPMRIPVPAATHALGRGTVEYFDGIPLLSLANGPEQTLALVVKRMIDIVASMILLVLVSPIWLVAVLAMLLAQGRPVFFTQIRGGKRGRPFRILKFRTMELDAEERKTDLADRNERTGPAFKVTDDPRVTRLGRWLRKTSIDESPQLLNVLKGEMSLVGPRPQPLEEVQAYDFWHRRRLSMKPGITGLWQVTARHDPSFDTWVDLDLQYIDQWSPWMDFIILLKTPLATIRTPGI